MSSAEPKPRLSLRFLRRIVRAVVDEAPPRTAQERDHLDRPRTEEARLLLAFVPTLDTLPVDPAMRDLMPAVRLMLENTALECEEVGENAERRRLEVKAWVQAIRAAVKP